MSSCSSVQTEYSSYSLALRRVLAMENAPKFSKRRLKKQCIERQRRETIKKSLEKLALLVPEAKERVAKGKRLKHATILQLTIDYIRSGHHLTNDESKICLPWNSSIIHEMVSCQYCHQNYLFMDAFQQSSERNGFHQVLSAGDHQGRQLFSPEVVFQDSTNVSRQQDLALSPQYLQNDVNNISGSLKPTSCLGSCSEQSFHSNMASSETNISNQVQPKNNVAMETARSYTQPLQALQSLCLSIGSPDDLNAQASENILFPANHPISTQTSQLETASIRQGSFHSRILSETQLLVSNLPSSLPPVSQGVWRPWVYRRET